LNVFGSSGPGSSGGEEDDDDKPASFGEKLRAGIDDEDEDRSDEEKGKVTLTELESELIITIGLEYSNLTKLRCFAATTGEEDEDTLHQVRGKLFYLSSQNQWKERGTGTLKLNVRRSDGGGARLG
jgi:Ran-binding protein 3